MTKLRITLITADDCVGILDISDDKDHEKPMVWDREPDRETTGATFELIDNHGKTEELYEIDGHAWRELESSGEMAYLWFWIARGVRLDNTVIACIEGVDPDGYNSDYEHTVEELRDQAEKLNERLAIAIRALTEIHTGSTATGRWLDDRGHECSEDDEGATWESYTEEEQNGWLESVGITAREALAKLQPEQSTPSTTAEPT